MIAAQRYISQTTLNHIVGDLVGVLGMLGGIVLFLSFWNFSVTGITSITAIAVFALITGLFYVYGRVCAWMLTGLALDQVQNFTFQILCGFFAFNTSLFVLSIVSPLSAVGNILLLAFCGVALLMLVAVRQRAVRTRSVAELPDIVCILVSGIGATLWCHDSLSPIIAEGPVTIFRMWPDSFFHARQISIFAQAHGFWTMSDLQMSGAPLRLYHYAIYSTPAAVSSLTNTGAYEVFAGFVLPFGIMLTGLAAFSLITSIWGAWPGVAAAFAVVVLPDAYHQGFANKFLSVNFMQQVNVGGLYGVALAALAWFFMLDGCRRGRYAPVLLAYFLILVCLFYKAHIFVANVFLIMIYPCLFFAALKGKWRIMIAVLLVAAFVWVVKLSQGFEGVPTLRLDGSGAASYSVMLADNYEPGLFKACYDWGLQNLQSKPVLGFYVAGMILISTLGVWLVLCLAGVWLLRSCAHKKEVLWFPLLIMGNYVVMSLGLAMEENGIGNREEFLNRPLVWAGFVVSAWSLGALYFVLFGNSLPRTWPSRALVGLLALLSFVSPLVFAPDLQTFSLWKGARTFRDHASVPTCLVDAAHFIRAHSQANEIMQDSEGDPRLVVTALSERQAYYAIFDPKSIGNQRTSQMLKGVNQRRDELAGFMAMDNAKEVSEFVSQHKISWFLSRPESKVLWPTEILDRPAFECGAYRVYRFETNSAASKDG